MVFSSAIFLYCFLPLTLAVYFMARGIAMKNVLLLLASLFFYTWGELGYVVVLLVSITANKILGVRISVNNGARKRFYLILAITVNLLLLGYYKYANFITDNINLVLGGFSISPIDLAPVHLPLGISFFTFQAITYVVDVYRGVAPAQKRFLHVALYVSLFPQLIAGPIVRYNTIATQLNNRSTTLEDFAEGARRFIIGLAKKLLVANVLGETADQIFSASPNNIGAAVAWLGIVCYALQIYFDFSGYSDMAIGLGRMFGFHFPENFNHPYVARSVQEFWRRWHISLSTWFRDYVYIPLGGNRKSPLRTYLNLVLVFFLCGLWHGASWNFVVWGLFHGVFLVVERLGFAKVLEKMPKLFAHAYLILMVLIGWVFFRSEDLNEAIVYLFAMFGLSHTDGITSYIAFYSSLHLWVVLGLAVTLSMPIKNKLLKLTSITPQTGKTINPVAAISYDISLIVLLGFCTLAIAANTYNPFIYFRF